MRKVLGGGAEKSILSKGGGAHKVLPYPQQGQGAGCKIFWIRDFSTFQPPLPLLMTGPLNGVVL